MAAALVFAPLTTAGAAAAELIGEVGAIEPATSQANGTDYWKERYAAYGAECFTHEGEPTPHGWVTDYGKTVTLAEFDPSWTGDSWIVLIVKGGTSNNVVENPVAGVAYASPINGGGQQSDVSHWIVCKGTTSDTQPTVVTPSLTVTPPTCEADGSAEPSDDAEWVWVENANGTVTWTASPKPGTVFAPGAQDTWVVPDLDRLDTQDCRPRQPPADEKTTVDHRYDCASGIVTTTTVTTVTPYEWDGEAWVPGEPQSSSTSETQPMTPSEKSECPPDSTTEYGSWEDGEWECGDTTVTQTRQVTTTVLNEYGMPAGATVTTETQTRELTQDELGECPLVPGDIESVCVGDVPYLGYSVTLPEGFTPDSATPLTITFVNPDGEDYVVTNQPLSGTLLWPGASAGEPKMWPGWELVDGEYVKTDGNYDWTRNGVTVLFEVNPSYSTTVAYPPASALCANPAATGDPAALAVTGGGVNPIVVASGAAALAAGVAALVIGVLRRSRTHTR